MTLNGLWDFYLDMDDFGSSQSNPGSFYCRFSGYTSSKIQYKPNTPNYTIPDPLNPGTLTNSGKVSWTNSLQDNSLANQRLGGSLASVLYCLEQGVDIFRVHDVQETHQAITIYNEIKCSK